MSSEYNTGIYGKLSPGQFLKALWHHGGKCKSCSQLTRIGAVGMVEEYTIVYIQYSSCNSGCTYLNYSVSSFSKLFKADSGIYWWRQVPWTFEGNC